MYCRNCGVQNDDNNYTCVKCGQILAQGQQAPIPPATSDHSLSGLIPDKNPNAVIAYYLAVFSLIPCIGLFLGIAAFYLGLKGLRMVKEHPEVRGKTHALVGVIGGGFFALVWLVLGIVGLFGIVAAAHH